MGVEAVQAQEDDLQLKYPDSVTPQEKAVFEGINDRLTKNERPGADMDQDGDIDDQDLLEKLKATDKYLNTLLIKYEGQVKVYSEPQDFEMGVGEISFVGKDKQKRDSFVPSMQDGLKEGKYLSLTARTTNQKVHQDVAIKTYNAYKDLVNNNPNLQNYYGQGDLDGFNQFQDPSTMTKDQFDTQYQGNDLLGDFRLAVALNAALQTNPNLNPNQLELKYTPGQTKPGLDANMIDTLDADEDFKEKYRYYEALIANLGTVWPSQLMMKIDNDGCTSAEDLKDFTIGYTENNHYANKVNTTVKAGVEVQQEKKAFDFAEVVDALDFIAEAQERNSLDRDTRATLTAVNEKKFFINKKILENREKQGLPYEEGCIYGSKEEFDKQKVERGIK